MKWVKVDDYWYHADHIVKFQWSMGKLRIWDDGNESSAIVNGLICPIESVSTFDDQNREKYKSLCEQLGLDCIAGTNEGGKTR